MTEILLRARKSPFRVATAEETLVQNLIAVNAGNLIFSTAAYKILDTPGTTVTVDRFVIEPGEADRINERYDAYVIPLANAFRLTFEPVLIRMTQLIRRLRIPVVVLGVGSQSNVRNDSARLDPIEPAVRDFVAAVLDRGPSIGVRGELTADYLARLGFRDVDVIGCPSMFLHGDRMTIEKRTPALERDARLSINVSPYVKAMGPIVRHHVERYPNLTYIPQDLDTLEMLLWGEAGPPVDPAEPRPVHLRHPLFRDDKVRFFVDPWPWFEHLAGRDFAFGSRIHGNIAALIAGTPAFVLAHDSRTLELVRYFEIPHRLIADVRPDTDAAELYAEADYGPLHRGHARRFATFTAYLARHGLAHTFATGDAGAAFDARMAATPFAPAVTVTTRTGPLGVAGRWKRAARRIRRAGRDPRLRRLRVLAGRGRGGARGRAATD